MMTVSIQTRCIRFKHTGLFHIPEQMKNCTAGYHQGGGGGVRAKQKEIAVEEHFYLVTTPCGANVMGREPVTNMRDMTTMRATRAPYEEAINRLPAKGTFADNG